jgi:hypothetical protein
MVVQQKCGSPGRTLTASDGDGRVGKVDVTRPSNFVCKAVTQ